MPLLHILFPNETIQMTMILNTLVLFPQRISTLHIEQNINRVEDSQILKRLRLNTIQIHEMDSQTITITHNNTLSHRDIRHLLSTSLSLPISHIHKQAHHLLHHNFSHMVLQRKLHSTLQYQHFKGDEYA